MTDAYARVTYHGHTLNKRTRAMIQQMEHYLGYDLTILQGSYHRGVGASAGTHDGGGAVDLAPADAANKVRAGRMVGFAMWERQAIPGVWPHHIHGIAVKDAQMSDMARRQVQDYYAHLNGLRGHAHDSTWRPGAIVPFEYPLKLVDFSNVRHQASLDKPNKALPGVKRLQRALNLKTGTHLAQDGLYGDSTSAAMRRYERQIGGDGSSDPSKHALVRLGLALFNVKE